MPTPFTPAGFWGAPTSTVDWCEANYAHSRYICELFNTVSSLSMLVAGLLGLCLHRRLLERRFLLGFASVALVGLGSIAFHASLRFELQMADELPMLYAVIVMVYILLENGPERRFGAWFPLALASHALLVTALAALTRGNLQFYLFHASFGSMEAFSLYAVYRLQRGHPSARLRRLYRTGMSAYLLAIGLWFLDLKFCSLLSERLPALGAFNPQLHAVWHVLVSCGFYCLLLVIAYVRLERLGRQPQLERWLGVIPALGSR
ncbi:MAG TPA: ceramidase [Polyangiaceae bacterium]|nr:ceramidase [Polyangiaceae bacterium]